MAWKAIAFGTGAIVASHQIETSRCACVSVARHAWVFAVLLGAATAPLVGAQETEGSFVARGAVSLSPDSEVGGPLLAALLHQPIVGNDIVSCSFTATRVVVHEYSLNAIGSPVAGYVHQGAQRVGTYEFTNPRVRLVPIQSPSHVGLDPMGVASATLTFASEGATTARDHSVIESDAYLPAHSRYDVEYYHRQVDALHMLSEGPGVLAVEGAVVAKVYGMRAILESDEGTRIFDTGMFEARPDATVPEGTLMRVRWIVVEAEEISLTAESLARVTIATSHVQGVSAGSISFHAESGRIENGTGSREVPDGSVRLDGTYEAVLVPALQADELLTSVRLHGQPPAGRLDAGTQGTAVPVGVGAFPWLVVLGAVAACGVGVGALQLRRRARPAAPAVADAEFSAEDCYRQAEAQIEAGDFAKALGWIERARRLAPTSVAACATHAFVLGELGRFEEALRLYQEASRLAPSEGEHALSAARLALQAGRPRDVVEDLLEQALSREPSLVEEVEAEAAGSFAALAGRSRYDLLVQAAWRRHLAGLSGDGKAGDPP